MRRIVLRALPLLPLLAIFSLPAAASAQVPLPAVWVRGYEQLNADGCLEYVAQWTDGTFTSTTAGCPPGVVPARGGLRVPVLRTFSQRTIYGCVEFVTQWLDGVYTWVPFSCPLGVLYFKPNVIPPLVFVPVAPGLGPNAPPIFPSSTTGVRAVAWVNERQPQPLTTVTVFGQFTVNGNGIAGVPMDTVWSYDVGFGRCSAVTRADGVAACSLNIGLPRPGYVVVIDVGFTYLGQIYTAQATFIPR